MDEYKDSPEALAWLRANPNTDSGFASNRFTIQQAIQFVEALYAGGATKVVIPETSIREEEEVKVGLLTPYSDSMVVFYESDNPDNETMVRMCLQEIESEGFLVKTDENGEEDPISVDEAVPASMAGNSFYLWWD